MNTLLKTLLISLTLASAAMAQNYIIDQKGKTFSPTSLNVKVGDTITFTNSDPFAHNAYTDDEANEFDTGMQSTNTEKVVAIKKAGTFSVECAIHPNMLLEVTAE